MTTTKKRFQECLRRDSPSVVMASLLVGVRIQVKTWTHVCLLLTCNWSFRVTRQCSVGRRSPEGVGNIVIMITVHRIKNRIKKQKRIYVRRERVETKAYGWKRSSACCRLISILTTPSYSVIMSTHTHTTHARKRHGNELVYR